MAIVRNTRRQITGFGGLRGPHSRVQDTAFLISEMGRGVYNLPDPPPVYRGARKRDGRGVSGPHSRVQDTAFLISEMGEGVYSLPTQPGMGAAPIEWFLQGVSLGVGQKFFDAILEPPPDVVYDETVEDVLKNIANNGLLGLMGPSGYRGIGQSLTQQTVMSAGTMTTLGLTAASKLGATWATAAIPIVGPIVAGVTIGLSLLFGRKGPKQKVATTEIVNKIEPLLKENVEGYLSGPRTRSSQLQAIENFKAGWQFVVEHCGIPEMGEPGQRCINDRKEGATTPWGGPNWFEMYLDPIRNDPNVKPDPGEVQMVEDPATGRLVPVVADAEVGDMTPLLVGAGLLAAAFLW